MSTPISGIDPATWQVSLLPYPKRYSRGKALGFCGDAPAGVVETANSKVAACWWPGGTPALLEFENHKDLQALFAHGDTIPGSWSRNNGGQSGAAAWRLAGGSLIARDLHDPRFERTWAEGAGGGLVVGVGVHKGRFNARPKDSGLIWNEAGELRELTGPEDVCLRATDGRGVAGSIGGRATFWPAPDAEPVDLAPADMPASEVHALDGESQAGYAFAAIAAHAMLWRGSAASALDLTPAGFEESRAFDAAQGYQVGQVRRESSTRGGMAAYDDHAVIWQGSPDRWFDLNTLLPAPFNASNAWAIRVTAGQILVCGEAREVEVSEPGTQRESHGVARSQAVLWSVARTSHRG